MSEQQQGGPDTAHDRVKQGYWPEIAGDQRVTIDLDSPHADKVAAELPEDWQARRERWIAEQPKRAAKAERAAAERERASRK